MPKIKNTAHARKLLVESGHVIAFCKAAKKFKVFCFKERKNYWDGSLFPKAHTYWRRHKETALRNTMKWANKNKTMPTCLKPWNVHRLKAYLNSQEAIRRVDYLDNV